MSRLAETEEALRRIEAISASSMNQATAKQILNMDDAGVTKQLLKEKFNTLVLLIHPDKLHQIEIPDDQKRALIARATQVFRKVKDARMHLLQVLEEQESAIHRQGTSAVPSAQPAPTRGAAAEPAPSGQAARSVREETLWDAMTRDYDKEYAKVQKDFQEKLERSRQLKSEELIKQLQEAIGNPSLPRHDLYGVTGKYEHSPSIPFFNIQLRSPGPELKAIDDCVQNFYIRRIDTVPRSAILAAINSCTDQKGAKSHRAEILMNPSLHPDDKSGVSMIIREIGEKYNAESHRLQEEMTRKYPGPRR